MGENSAYDFICNHIIIMRIFRQKLFFDNKVFFAKKTYFSPKKVFFVKKKCFSLKIVFFQQKTVFFAKNYFSLKKSIFPPKQFFSPKKKYFSPKKVFFVKTTIVIKWTSAKMFKVFFNFWKCFFVKGPLWFKTFHGLTIILKILTADQDILFLLGSRNLWKPEICAHPYESLRINKSKFRFGSISIKHFPIIYFYNLFTFSSDWNKFL